MDMLNTYRGTIYFAVDGTYQNFIVVQFGYCTILLILLSKK